MSSNHQIKPLQLFESGPYLRSHWLQQRLIWLGWPSYNHHPLRPSQPHWWELTGPPHHMVAKALHVQATTQMTPYSYLQDYFWPGSLGSSSALYREKGVIWDAVPVKWVAGFLSKSDASANIGDTLTLRFNIQYKEKYIPTVYFSVERNSGIFWTHSTRSKLVQLK